MNISIVGIDIAKNVFQLHAVDKTGKVVIKKRVGVELPITPQAVAVPTRGNATIGNHRSSHTVSWIPQQLRLAYLRHAPREHVLDCNNAGTLRAFSPDQAYSRKKHDRDILCERFRLNAPQKGGTRERWGVLPENAYHTPSSS